MSHKSTLYFFLILIVMQLSLCARADAPAREDFVIKKHSDEPLNKGSDASFDKRLPPVLPGERMNDSGKRTRVWSTAGEVSVSEPTEPKSATTRYPIPNVDVIVDGRRALPTGDKLNKKE